MLSVLNMEKGEGYSDSGGKESLTVGWELRWLFKKGQMKIVRN